MAGSSSNRRSFFEVRRRFEISLFGIILLRIMRGYIPVYYRNDNATTVKSASFEPAGGLWSSTVVHSWRFLLARPHRGDSLDIPTQGCERLWSGNSNIREPRIPWNFKEEAKHRHCRVKMLFDCLKLQRLHPTHTIIHTIQAYNRPQRK